MKTLATTGTYPNPEQYREFDESPASHHRVDRPGDDPGSEDRDGVPKLIAVAASAQTSSAGRPWRPGLEQVGLNAGEVPFHDLDRVGELARAQRFHELDVIGLVGRPPFPRVVATLEVAPDLALAGSLDRRIHREQQLVAAGGDDRVVKGEVPDFELAGALRSGTTLQASAQLIEVSLRRPGHHEGKHLRLDHPACRHHVGRPNFRRRTGKRPGPARPGTGRPQEGPTPDLARDAPLGLQAGEGVANHRPRHPQLGDQGALCRKPPTESVFGRDHPGEDQLGQIVAVCGTCHLVSVTNPTFNASQHNLCAARLTPSPGLCRLQPIRQIEPKFDSEPGERGD